MKNITEIIVVSHREFKNVKGSILSSIIVPKMYKYSKGQIITIKKTFFGWFLYGSIKVEIVEITKNILVKGFRSSDMLIIFKKLPRS